MSEITTFGGKTTVREPGREADLAVEDLLARVGDRVRKARELKGLPRRVISETSGVSMRYLAQLEAGEGNISIGLLKRVALALDMPLDWLLGEEDPWNSDVLRFAEAYRLATAEVRRRAEHALVPEPPWRNRVLVGEVRSGFTPAAVHRAPRAGGDARCAAVA